VKQETLGELKKKYKKVDGDECKKHWNMQFESSAKTCSHAFWKGNCKNRMGGTLVKELRVHRRAGGSWALSSPPPPSTSWSRCLALARRRTRRSSTSCPAACPMGLSSKLMGDLVAQSKPSPTMLNELGALRLAAVNPAEELA